MDNLPATLPPETPNGKTLVTMLDEQPASLPMPVQIDKIVERVEAVNQIVNRVFKDELHFGKIPGTGDKKVLLKPGLDALCLAFQFSPDFVKQPESIERDNFISIVYKCRLIHSPTGRVVATSDGACNSREEKYRWLPARRKCPNCGKEAIIKGKAEYGGGWVCFEKKGGCNSKWREGDRAIEGQAVGQVENENPWNNYNTLLKMAQKRAGMAAIITACGLSGDFTQDLEDSVDYGSGPSPSNAGAQWPGNPPTSQAPASSQPSAREEEDFHRARYEADAEPADAKYTTVPDSELFPADILKAREGVMQDLPYCKTKEDFQKLIAGMRSRGGAMIDKRVTCLVNDAYAKLFPAPPKTTGA